MNAAPARAAEQHAARRLTVLASPHVRPPRTPFVIVVVAILSAGLVGLLLLNTTLAQGSFRVHDLQQRTAALQDQEQQLQLSVDASSNPARLAAAARALGLVPAQDPGFIRLSDGRVLGEPQAATAPPKPTVPTPSAAPSPRASAGPTPATTARPGTNR